jgi:hypothetical protein
MIDRNSDSSELFEKTSDMAIATFNGDVLQVHKTTNKLKNTLHYFLRHFPSQKSSREFSFEYKEGHLELRDGDATDRERDLLIHCIQALELSGAFYD